MYKYRPIKKTKKKLKTTDAKWQFILDHSTPVNGGWHCQFFYKNKKDYTARMVARKYGLHRLDSINEEWREVQTKHQDYLELKKKFEKLENLKGIKKWLYNLLK